MTQALAFVTGASRGIGLAVATRLTKLGYRVVGTATTMAGVEKLSHVLQQANPDNDALQLDLADRDDVKKQLQRLLNDYGTPDVIVNNAGITRDNLFLRLAEDDWDAVIDTNLSGVFQICKTLVKPMLKQRRGSIVNISSVIGSTGNAGQANYAAAKAGIDAFSRSLAQELASRNITVNSVAPGFIATDMTDGLPESQKEAILANIPSKRLGCVDDIAGTVAFLVSEDARYITGQTIHVNGGMYMG